jgi:hypothetical protein
MKTASAIFTAALLLALPAAAQTLMAQADVESALKGNSFAVTAQSGWTGLITFNADMTLASSGDDDVADTGTYRFGEGGYCSTWVGFREGVEACFTAEKLGEGRYQLYTLDGAKDDLLVRQ